MKFTIKNSVYDKNLSITSAANVIKAIKGGFVKQKIDELRSLKSQGLDADAKIVKDSLPIMFCGEYHDLNGGTGMDKTFDHSGVIFMDLDKLEDGEAERLKDIIKCSDLYKYVVFAFTSPSGGLKIALRTEYCDTDNEFHKHVYSKLVKLCIKCGLPEQHIDTQVNNSNRGNYFSYDPAILIGKEFKSIPVKQWYPEYNEMKIQIDEHQKVRKLISETGDVDSDYAKNYAEKVFASSVSRMGPGNRHLEIFKLGVKLYQCGMDQQDVAQYFTRLKAAGHYTESMTPIAKARDVYKAWDGIIDSRFIKKTQSSAKSLAAALIANFNDE